MNRTSAIERLYFLGDFKNIKITDTISEIPEEVFLNKEAMDSIVNLQLISTEHTYTTYLKLINALPKTDYDTIEKLLNEAKSRTFEQLIKQLKIIGE